MTLLYGSLFFVALIVFFLGFRFFQHQKPQYAQVPDHLDLQTKVEWLAANYLAQRPNGGLVIGIYQQGQQQIFGFSGANQPTRPNEQTVYEIGSITKVFTGIALSQLVLAEKVTLDDCIGDYLPDLKVAPAIAAITLRQLATHTSGLPRLPMNLLLPPDWNNPYAHYQAKHLYRALTSLWLWRKPGKKFVYSNLGVGLLGHLLELKMGKPYETLIKEIICNPLQMQDTTISLTTDQQQRLISGYAANGKAMPNWDIGVLAGAGGLRSTASDMLTFLVANLKTNETSLSQALAYSHQVQFQQEMEIAGLGWAISEFTQDQATEHTSQRQKQVVYWHNGCTGGYASFMGFDKANQFGVVVLSNYAATNAALDRIGVSLIKDAAKTHLSCSNF